MGSVTVGLDVGQQRDPTAVAVVEREVRTLEEGHWMLPTGERLVDPRDIQLTSPKTDELYLVRHIARLPLGTSYPAVAERIAELIAGVRERYKGRLVLNVDATGVGLPVVDLIREKLKGAPNLETVAVTFTGTERYEVKGKTATLGKAFLVSRLQALLQTERIKLPRTAETEALARELQDYEIRVSEDANLKAGAFKVGTHDDLVTALGLAVLPPGPSRRLVRW